MRYDHFRLAAAAGLALSASAFAGDDTIRLSDAPGNWFRSDATGTPFTAVDVGGEIDFVINGCCTNTRHTVTLLVKPEGSAASADQDQSQNGNISVEFDVPGVYVFVCKIHPYMTAVVGVRDAAGFIPPVSAASLPFIGHLGAPSLPPEAVLGVVTTVAASDADKAAKWDIFPPTATIRPVVPGVGEVWIDAQFERVPGQADSQGVAKPGTIVVLDAETFTVEREINGLAADGRWNNPHNMWASFDLDTVYNTNWFGQWLNRIDRASGQITGTITVGQAPTHVINDPGRCSPQQGVLSIPLSAGNDIVKVVDDATGFYIIGHEPTGEGRNHPHGHWLTCGQGARTIVPNVFKGLGVGGSISILDTVSGEVLREFEFDPQDPVRSALQMPIAAGECHVNGVHKAYVANGASGFVTVIDVDAMQITGNIPVTLTPDDQTGFALLHTLQVPIQTPVSPDERWVATAVFSITTVDRASTGAADHVAIIDTATDQVVRFLPTPAGAHGVNWGAKLGGGYYAYVTAQHSNALIVIDPDPNGDGSATDAAVVGRIVLANTSPGAGVTDGTGGQGVKPLPMTHDGWIQKAVALAGTGALSPEVEGWIAALTPGQRDPSDGPDCPPDFDRDCKLTLADFGAFQTAFALASPRADFDGDGRLTLADFGAFRTAFALGCPD
ncbi:MAG: hypothetical protein IT437_03180 [Phycisphaerales bacterium]|nr:hypothetical protein [Phycisphaerales bacterium]